jgi:hypothetical protein
LISAAFHHETGARYQASGIRDQETNNQTAAHTDKTGTGNGSIARSIPMHTQCPTRTLKAP